MDIFWNYTFTILVASSSILFILLHVVCLILFATILIFLTSEAHFSALEFGFQVSSTNS